MTPVGHEPTYNIILLACDHDSVGCVKRGRLFLQTHRNKMSAHLNLLIFFGGTSFMMAVGCNLHAFSNLPTHDYRILSNEKAKTLEGALDD